MRITLSISLLLLLLVGCINDNPRTNKENPSTSKKEKKITTKQEIATSLSEIANYEETLKNEALLEIKENQEEDSELEILFEYTGQSIKDNFVAADHLRKFIPILEKSLALELEEKDKTKLTKKLELAQNLLKQVSKTPIPAGELLESLMNRLMKHLAATYNIRANAVAGVTESVFLEQEELLNFCRATKDTSEVISELRLTLKMIESYSTDLTEKEALTELLERFQEGSLSYCQGGGWYFMLEDDLKILENYSSLQEYNEEFAQKMISYDEELRQILDGLEDYLINFWDLMYLLS